MKEHAQPPIRRIIERPRLIKQLEESQRAHDPARSPRLGTARRRCSTVGTTQHSTAGGSRPSRFVRPGSPRNRPGDEARWRSLLVFATRSHRSFERSQTRLGSHAGSSRRSRVGSQRRRSPGRSSTTTTCWRATPQRRCSFTTSAAGCKCGCSLASRSRPSWATARSAIYGELLELGPDDLALTDRGERDVLVDAPVAFRDELLAQANGWPAVIGLAALARSPRQTPTTRSRRRCFASSRRSSSCDHATTASGCALLAMALLPALSRELMDAQFGDDARDLLADASAQGFVTMSEQRPRSASTHSRISTLQSRPQQRCVTNAFADAVSLSLQREAWDNALGLIKRFDRVDLVDTFLESAFMPLARMGRVGTLEQVAAFARSGSVDFSPPVTLIGAELALRDGLFQRAEALATRSAEGLGCAHVLTPRALDRRPSRSAWANYRTAATTFGRAQQPPGTTATCEMRSGV